MIHWIILKRQLVANPALNTHLEGELAGLCVPKWCRTRCNAQFFTTMSSENSREDPESVAYLELQYSPSKWSKAHNPDKVVQIFIDECTKASAKYLNSTKLKYELDIRYGERDGQKLDLFFPSDNAEQSFNLDDTLLVFFHGGYWQACSKEMFSYLGGTFGPHGITTAVVGYDLCPKVKVDTIVEEVRESVAFLRKRFPKSRIFLSGTSAGGQLTAMLLAMDLKEFSFNGAMIFSGVFDLRPLVKTYVNDPLQMSEEDAWKNSPMKYLNNTDTYSSCPVLCMIGDEESPEFKRQNKEYCEVLLEKGCRSRYLVIEGCDHFNIIERLVDPDFVATKEMLKFMKEAVCER